VTHNIEKCSIEQYFLKVTNVVNGEGIQGCLQSNDGCCNIFAKNLLNDNYKKFVTLMKESQGLNWGNIDYNYKRWDLNDSEFIGRYIFGSKSLRELNLTLATGLRFIKDFSLKP
jgi:hypothetical protein